MIPKLAALAVVLTGPLIAAAAIMYGPQPERVQPSNTDDLKQLFEIVTWTPTPCTEIEGRLRMNGCPETLR